MENLLDQILEQTIIAPGEYQTSTFLHVINLHENPSAQNQRNSSR